MGYRALRGSREIARHRLSSVGLVFGPAAHWSGDRTVELMRIDIVADRGGEFRRSPTGREAGADVRTGHRKVKSIDTMNASAGWGPVLISLAGDDDEIDQTDEILPSMPSLNLLERIRTN